MKKNKLDAIFQEYLHLKKRLKDPVVLRNIELYTTLSQRFKPLERVGKLLEKKDELEATLQDLTELKQDEQLKPAVEKEISAVETELKTVESVIMQWWTRLQGEKARKASIIVEMRAATGGDEASLFVANILAMYVNFFKKEQWKFKIIEQRRNLGGGYSYVAISIDNENAFKKLQFEGGVHRVQRVPKTETQGRVHTSTITVAVLEKVTAQKFPLDPKDLRIDTFRSSGAGGQSVNTTDSAVRIVHLPSGIMVSCQDGRSQHDNKERALEVLRARLYKQQTAQASEKNQTKRQQQIGSGMRSEKIRTYNYPQNRITDHRIKKSFSGIEQIMHGNLGKIIAELELKNDETNGEKNLLLST